MEHIFAYREKNYNRDSCCYISNSIGSHNVEGPCFSKSFGSDFNRGQVNYDDIETFLTEQEYYNACANGVTQELINTLTSQDAIDYANYIFEDEKVAMMDEFNLRDQDVSDILNEYSLDYYDRGIIGYVDDNWAQLAHEEAWQLGYLDQPYFDEKAFMEDLQESYWYLELSNGRVVRLNY